MKFLPFWLICLAVCTNPLSAQETVDHIPLGGLGTGYIELKSDGSVQDITINNNRLSPVTSPSGSFAAIYTSGPAGRQAFKLQQDTSDPQSLNHSSFSVFFPEARIEFQDQRLPVSVTVQAMAPFVLGDIRLSTIPAVLYLYHVRNTSGRSVDVALAVSWENIIGLDGIQEHQSNGICTQTPFQSGNLTGIRFSFQGNQSTPSQQNATGEQVLFYAGKPDDRISILPSWNAYQSPTTFWSPFQNGGTFSGGANAVQQEVRNTGRPAAAISAQRTLAPGESVSFPFILSWHMPNQIDQTGKNAGVYYTNEWKSAEQAGEYVARNWQGLLQQIRDQHHRYLNPSLPEWFSRRLFLAEALLVQSGVFLQNGDFSFLTTDPAYPGNLGSPEERLAMTPFLLRWYPQLLEREIRRFARHQLSDGEVPSAAGHLSADLHSADIPGGFLGRPDSSAAFILLIYDYYRWTGDTRFMKDLHPNLRAALLWLLNQDSNGDSIPNGPSLWHEVNSRYTSLFTSDLWLTALRVGEELLGELEMQSQARAMRIESANNLNSQLWNGRYYNIYFDPSNPLSSLDQPYLLGNLPGERFTFSIGLNSFLDVHRLNRNFHSLASSFDTIHESSLIIPSPSATAQLFAQAFDAAALIRFGYVNETLSYLQKTPVEYQIQSDISLWSVLEAYSGTSIDQIRRTLITGPILPANQYKLLLPFSTANLRGYVQYQRSGQAAAEQCDFIIEEVFSGQDALVQQIAFLPQAQSAPDQYTLRVLYNNSFVAGQDFTREQLRVFGFEKPIRVKAGDEFTLIISSQPSGKILVDLDQYEYINIGTLCEIQPLAIAPPNLSLQLTNLLPLKQIINLQFRQGSSTQYSVYLNGVKMPLTPNASEAFPVLLQNSSLSQEDYQWLRMMSVGIQQAIGKAARHATRQDLLKQLWRLQEEINQLVERDNAMRGVRIDVLSALSSSSPRVSTNVDRQNLGQNLQQFRQSLAQFRQSLNRYTQDPILAAQIMGDLLPIQLQVTTSGIERNSESFNVTLQINKHPELNVDARADLNIPPGWERASSGEVSIPPAQLSRTVMFQVKPNLDLWQHKLSITAVVSGTWQGYPFRREFDFAVGHDFIREWMIIGPFPGMRGEGFTYSFPPQQNIQLGESYEGIDKKPIAWQKQTFPDGYINLDTTISPNDNAVAYAYIGVFSPREQTARLEIGASGDLKVFNNYKEILSRRNTNNLTPASLIEYTKLYNGWNHFLVKLSEGSGPWGFYLELTDIYGMPIPDLQYALDKAR